ncbi:MAG: type II/IV secretion system protein [Sterolibacteriaceae bacterium]|uniref:Type II/IV secretion system protein n=1 Tax=Candidatus Methylophosphatis roskildensis TaxID=2899263 RepID=A0A9D7E8G3_9PROT|nr:type II/IV secretion system protein [Candidatus Methylophosphatis roskildensis]
MNAVVSPRRFTQAELQKARAVAESARQPVVAVLEEQAGLEPDDFVAALGETLHYPTLTMYQLHQLKPAFDRVSFAEAMARECLVFSGPEGKGLIVVIGDPFNTGVLDWAESRVNQRFLVFIAHRSDIAAYMSRYEENLRAMDGMLPAEAASETAASGVDDLSFKTIAEDTSPVVKLVRSTLYDALKSDASDIHLESTPTGLVIKYRIDGVLNMIGSVAGVDMVEQVISRVKVMAELDIAERRVPQDGRFRVLTRGREVDFRVSVMPSIHGEDAVLRILDKQALADQMRGLRLDYLGFDDSMMVLLRKLANEPYGMFLVTGPTGSGKTTTLYAAISEINHGRDKIITIEDPVEYGLPGVLQIPVNEKKGLTFARGLRSILRHDPDKIMVGEIRDAETAQIAIQSALTGHLVFTTVHANNVFDVLGRFTHMGVDPYSFVSALNAVLAQRLVRVNCPHCAAPDKPGDGLLADSGLTRTDVADWSFRAGRGCGQCRGTGYKGRKAIAEVLQLNDEIRELIVARAPIRAIKDAAVSNGLQFLRESALGLVKRGDTTLSETNRVTFVD